jgi:hypothetical protein
LILVDFRGIDITTCKGSIINKLIKLCVANKAVSFELLFSKSKELKRGFAINFGHKPVAFYLALITLANKAFFRALE